MSDPRALLQKADKNINAGTGMFKMFVDLEGKYEEAVTWCTEAANELYTREQFIESGNAFEKAANIYIGKLDRGLDAAPLLVEASETYVNDPEGGPDAIRCLNAAIEIFRKKDLSRAAKHMESMASVYQKQLNNPQKAMECYEQAATWQEKKSNAQITANNIWLKAADIAVNERNYEKAIKIFEKVGKGYIGHKNMRFSVKGYLFNAGICHLAEGGLTAVNNALEDYSRCDSGIGGFATQKEYQLLMHLSAASEDNSTAAFRAAVEQYKFLLNNWQMDVLNEVESKLEAAIKDKRFLDNLSGFE
ncbi:vesicular-fusion protein S17 [Conoideocrella luteorostrata]|uniref:Vesicular-fusion protein S17 n=1 Tax=Conoideocrella luteorostrata TaxID=1105319 RepID=A0AAJ0FU11_9HYPO|nr:vesicular-fusion protein S17 [Conoideocrella luteorostrata]